MRAAEIGPILERLKGGINTSQGLLLARHAAAVTHGCIVEVGSYRGKSAVALVLGARKNDTKPDVYCVEPHRPFKGLFKGESGPVDREEYFRTMLAAGCAQEAALVNLSSREVTAGWRLPVGLLFLNGDHTYEGVRDDLQSWLPHLTEDAVVIFDDVEKPEAGPTKLVPELLASGDFYEIDRAEKVVALRRKSRQATGKRILVVCNQVVMVGGLLRFDRIARVIREWGHEMAFVSVAGDSHPQRNTDLQVLTLDEASNGAWDCTMLAGAAFPDDMLQSLGKFNSPQFGVRVQHILNDQTRRDQFKQANDHFRPHVVIFNNSHWPPGSYADFRAARFHTLIGAVDTQFFNVKDQRPATATKKWIIGGLANKNPEPLVQAACSLLNVELRLFGRDRHGLAEKFAKQVNSGQLRLLGSLDEEELRSFYHDLDCVVMTERHAGWANLCAEAMASGVPVICTAHGTGAFAFHEETALIVREPDPAAIASALSRLRTDTALRQRLTKNARLTIEDFGWRLYSDRLLSLCNSEQTTHYYYAPELGCHGKWPISTRTAGLEELLTATAGTSVLDFSAAEGAIAHLFLSAGAKLLHGFELEPDRVARATRICASFSNAIFRQADLSDWPRFIAANAGMLLERYDTVLMLGILHHLPKSKRAGILEASISLADRFYAFRAPEKVFREEHVGEVLDRYGFGLIQQTPADPGTDAGPCRVFERRS